MFENPLDKNNKRMVNGLLNRSRSIYARLKNTFKYKFRNFLANNH